MTCSSEKIMKTGQSPRNRRIKDAAVRSRDRRRGAFSLPEVAAALVIMSLVSSSILLVINRSMSSVADISLRMQAFEVARENMEYLLALDTAEEMTEYGVSEKYPEIEWQTTVEKFDVPTSLFAAADDSAVNPITNLFESFGLPGMTDPNAPSTSQTWVRALSIADYTDTDGEPQKVELVHWLARLTDQQIQQIAKQQAQLAEMVFGKDLSELNQDELDQLKQMKTESTDAARADQVTQAAKNTQARQTRQGQQDTQAPRQGPGPPPGQKGMTEQEFQDFIQNIFKQFK